MPSTRLSALTAGAVTLLALSVPAPAARADTGCDRALAAAERAERSYDAMKADLLRGIADGGHPDISQERALRRAEAERDATASAAQRACRP
ncbi:MULTISPECIES: hypothetical protein [Streptomyces]|uniref:Secreted protein n=1 Tax=Streptomyces misionensis TaxID=67331 RepID=A0A1H4WDJ7_9ACTN|nr:MULTISPECIES: hypothetical protein [Streptomyces]SEC91373.1 hypothetical protein SAMN04490357_3240 [Streptomyces misionensis]SFY50358.1 hypothetical protein STEPF1_03608 [Streptomyces sp. F-1]